MTGLLRYGIVAGATVALLLAMDALRLFGGVQFLGDWIRIETHYYFALLGSLLPLAFLIYPRQKFIDAALTLITFGICGYFFWHAEAVVDEAWEFGAPPLATWMSLALWIAVLEALRRSAGWSLFFIAGLFSLMPIVADYMPGPLSGLAATWQETAAYHALSIESIFGLPFRAFAGLVIGFILFGLALQHTGGGRFFLNLAFALLGRVRGGPAKVAIVSSGLMGSMSGSVVTNVLTTGQLTIPAMQRAGMSPHYAAGVEACASTGGVLLPPIMGSTAFVMATFLEIPYYEVALAAAIPALLYFIGLFLQVDAHAALQGLHGLDEDELPTVRDTLREGWYYVTAFAVLIFLLVVLQREAMAPYIATGMLLLLNQISPQERWNWRKVVEFLHGTGKLLVELVVVLGGVGLIVGALSLTGLGGTLVNDLLFIAGGSVALLLLMGAATSFVLGIGMTVTAAYVFLAIILAPALIGAGLPSMAVHLFILYWAMLSFITPPVALGAFAAASIAKSPPILTGVTAMRLGSIIYFIPFVFVLEPSLVLDGDAASIVLALGEALIGIWLLAGAIQGFLPLVGGEWRWWARWLSGLGGMLIALPSLDGLLDTGISNLYQALAGGVLIGGAFGGRWLILRQSKPVVVSQSENGG